MDLDSAHQEGCTIRRGLPCNCGATFALEQLALVAQNYVMTSRGLEVGDHAISLVCEKGQERFILCESVNGVSLHRLLILMLEHQRNYHQHPRH